MNHHERIARIFAGQSVDRPGFWLGNPHDEVKPRLLEHFGVSDDEAMRRLIGDDCRWYPADWIAKYNHSEGMWASGSYYSVFAECEDTATVDAYPWPDASHFDLAPLRTKVSEGEGSWRFGGSWSCFFHNVADMFGMENYFMMMYSDPDVVHAVTRQMVDFFLAVNKRVYTEARDTVDCFFFGNDFGTQNDLLVSPEKFKEFILPYFCELINQAKSYDVPVQLHSCGAIYKVIPWLIDAGIDALHPLQAKATGMDAETLMREYGGKITFVGGVDTQELLWRGTPQQIKDEVNRLHDIFGDRWIISPSHEAILPEVPTENIVALCEAATGMTLS